MSPRTIPVVWLLVALITHLLVLCLYWAAVYAQMPDTGEHFYLRAAAVSAPLFMFEEDYIAFAPIKLDLSAKHIIIHGDSQAATGIKPSIVAHTPDIIVNNFALRKAGIKRIRAVDSMLWEKGVLSEGSISQMILAFGLPSFIEHNNKDRFFDSKEMIANLPLSATSGGASFYKKYSQYHNVFWFLSRPMILVQMKLINFWPNMIGRKMLPIPVPAINAPYGETTNCLEAQPPIDDNMHAVFSEEAFEELELLLVTYAKKNIPVTIVSDPVQSCVREHRDYIYFKQRLSEIVSSHKILYLDNSELLEDRFFFDPFHVNGIGGGLWSSELRRYLGSQENNSR